VICKVFLHGCVTFWNIWKTIYILLLYIFVNYEANKKIINHEPAPKWRAKISPIWLHLFGCYSLPLLSPAPNKYVHDLLCFYHCFGFYEVLSHVYTHKHIRNFFSLKYHHTQYYLSLSFSSQYCDSENYPHLFMKPQFVLFHYYITPLYYEDLYPLFCLSTSQLFPAF